MGNNSQIRLGILGLLGVLMPAGVIAQDAPLPDNSVSIQFPQNSPLTLLSTMNQSRASFRGSALELDIHMSLSLLNSSSNRIHSVTLRVVSQEGPVGGKNWVAYPSLNIGPGETFPARIDTHLARPSQLPSGPLVEVTLDGVLFQDLSFFGPDKLNSRRTMTAWEMEAQRDREHFKRILAQTGRDGLKDEVIASVKRQGDRPQLQVRVRRGPSATSAALGPDHVEQFAFLKFPDSPIEPLDGWAQVAANEAHAPRIEVLNKSNKAIKYVELGWLVRDQNGQQYLAASLPASEPDLYLPAGQKARVLQETTIDLSLKGQPLKIQGMTGFVSQVQFADGKVWVPNRQSLDDPGLQKLLPPSAEEQRLTDLYTRKGLDALLLELKKF
jgi:hypothetical protein